MGNLWTKFASRTAGISLTAMCVTFTPGCGSDTTDASASQDLEALVSADSKARSRMPEPVQMRDGISKADASALEAQAGPGSTTAEPSDTTVTPGAGGTTESDGNVEATSEVAPSYTASSPEIDSSDTTTTTSTGTSDPVASSTASFTTDTTYSSESVYPAPVEPKSLPALSLPLPSYLVPQFNANTGTYVMRITDATAFGVSGVRVLRHAYSKIQPWNADGSRLLLGFTYPGYLLDGRTFQYLGRVNQPSDGVWSNTDPNLMYGTPINTNNFVKHDVRTNESTVVRAFTQYTALRLGSGEGNLSNDDRLVALFGKNSQGNIDAFVYDLATDTITGVLSLPLGWSQVQDISSTMSQSGNYVILDFPSRGTGPTQGKKVYDIQMNLLRTAMAGGGHSDVGIDASGNDVIVSADDPNGVNDRSFYMVRLADGARTKVLDGSAIGWQTHISCRATRRPGYCYISTFYWNPASDYDWAPLYNQGFAVKLDGSLKIEPFSQLLHGANTDYSRQPHLVPNRDGSLVLWASDWNNPSTDASVNAYVAGVQITQK